MYKKSIMPNGIRVVTEELPYVKSAAIGVWVNTGSRSEDEYNHGISHFIEHMMFKGTTTRSAKEIAEAADAVGGQLNAFTGREATCYFMKVLDTHIELAFDVLSDMLLASRFAAADVEREQQVVLEEYNMYEDTPEELINDLYTASVWPQHPLGRTILGTRESIRHFSREMVLAYYNRFYHPNALVIAAAGHVQHEQIASLVDRYFGRMAGIADKLSRKAPVLQQTCQVISKDIEQVHLCLGTTGLAQNDDNLFSMHVLNTILGGSVSSRLFQTVREESGLAYSIYSYPLSYSDAGLFTIYTATRPEKAEEVLAKIWMTIDDLRATLTAEEVTKTKEQLKGSLLLGLEDSGSIMNRLGKLELTLHRYVTLDEVIGKIDAVSLDKVRNLAAQMLVKEHFALTALGPLPVDSLCL